MFKTLRTALFGMGAFLLAGGLLAVPAQASDYPSKPIPLVSPYGAGGDSDLTARVWAEFAKKKLGQPVVVVNKTGGGGLTGSLFAAKAKPDGYTLFLAQAGPNIIIPLTAKGANYSFDSFDYIARIMVANCAVVVNKDAPWNAVLGGHADMTFLFPQNYAPMASADKLKILAIGTKSDVYPNAPTFAEQGYEGNYYGWAGIAAPKGTPKEILDRLAAISEEIVKDPEYIKAIKNMNATPDYSTGEAWMKQLKEQYAEMNKVLTDLGLTGNK